MQFVFSTFLIVLLVARVVNDRTSGIYILQIFQRGDRITAKPKKR